VVFDTPYVDLRRAPNTRGIVAWGAHDPGTSAAGRPDGVLDDSGTLRPLPGRSWTYGIPWPSPERTREMGEALGHALDVRARAARWLMTERVPDWDLFFAVAGEAHGAIEGLWHGVDPSHPLHAHPSAPAADAALRAVHRGLDRMVAEVMAVAGNAAVVAFAMGGMGPNHSDIQSMVLLPELLYRHAFARSLLDVPAAWAAAPRTLPILTEEERWETAKLVSRPASAPVEPGPLRRAARVLPRPVRAALKGIQAGLASGRHGPRRAGPRPRVAAAYHYAAHWPGCPPSRCRRSTTDASGSTCAGASAMASWIPPATRRRAARWSRWSGSAATRAPAIRRWPMSSGR
jgi:hypothetical protein